MRVVLVLAAVLLLAAPARAATVSVATKCSDRYKRDCSTVAAFVAAPGERNALTMERPSQDVRLFRDAGAVLVAGPGCVAVDQHTARCPAMQDVLLFGSARLGDGDDSAVVADGVLFGGRGDDRLTGGAELMAGGPGSDVLRAAGPGGTAFHDGDGREPARDRYLGGAGRDSISYAGRRARVRVDLRRPGPAGSPGERDVVSGVEDSTGGAGDDVLIGSAAANTLIGGRGADRIAGIAGDDRLVTGRDSHGGPQVHTRRDVVHGGGGRDTIEVTTNARGSGNLIDCGAERDLVVQTGRNDRVGRDCESLVIGDTLQLVRLRATLARPTAGFMVDRACYCRRGRYLALWRDHPVASARGRGGRIVMRLNDLGRRALAERHRLPVTVQYREPLGGELEIDGFKVELRLLGLREVTRARTPANPSPTPSVVPIRGLCPSPGRCCWRCDDTSSGAARKLA